MRQKIVELDERDVLLAPEKIENPFICWCYTKKFKKSCCLRDEKTGKTLVLINLRNLCSKKMCRWPIETVILASITYINYSLTHELAHYGIERSKIPEKVWDQQLIHLFAEQVKSA